MRQLFLMNFANSEDELYFRDAEELDPRNLLDAPFASDTNKDSTAARLQLAHEDLVLIRLGWRRMPPISPACRCLRCGDPSGLGRR